MTCVCFRVLPRICQGPMADLAGIVTKRGFGGIGIYSDGRFFAVIDNDTLLFQGR